MNIRELFDRAGPASRAKAAVLTPIVLMLSACASVPMGPTVQVWPSANKPFEVFQQDQESCKQYAYSQVAGQAEAANQRALGSGAIGALLGAGLGAAVGGQKGAGVGAAAGMIVGGASGAEATSSDQVSIQIQYNNAFSQCMYARGNSVPGASPTGQPAPPPSPPPHSVVVPPPPPPSVVVVPQPEVIYVTPHYATPGPGWVWMFSGSYGWGWHHPAHGWHRPGYGRYRRW